MLSDMRIAGSAACVTWLVGVLYLFTRVSAAPTTWDSTARMRTIAGKSQSGYGGDGGPGTSASLYNPSGVYFDVSLGAVIVGDGNNYCIRKIDSFSVISRIAGVCAGPSGSFTGDGGAATSADLNIPKFAITDNNGTMWISDNANNRIRKVNTLGIISTISGTGVDGHTGDNGVATSAAISSPRQLAWHPNGALYFAAFFDNTVRRIATDGKIYAVAGTIATTGFSGDGGAATSAQLNGPTGVIVEPSSLAIYIADSYNNRVRRVTSAGIISTYAGTGTGTYDVDNVAATSASLRQPTGLALDPNNVNVLFIADNVNNRIRRVGADGIITTIAGGSGTYLGDPLMATVLSFFNSISVTVDPISTSIYVADIFNNQVKMVYLWGITVYNASTDVTGNTSSTTVAAMVSLYDSSLESLCLWNNGNTSSPAVQLTSRRFRLLLRSTSATGSNIDIPCTSVAIRVPQTARTATCEKVADAICTVTPGLDGGLNWALVLQYFNISQPGYVELVQRSGPQLTYPAVVTNITLVAPSSAQGTCSSLPCVGKVFITGRNLGMNWLIRMGNVKTSWASGCTNVSTWNSSTVTYNCTIETDPSPWLWVQTTLTINVASSVATYSVQPVAVPPARSVQPQTIAWGDRINITALGVGSIGQAVIDIATNTSNTDTGVRCTEMVILSRDILQCRVRFLLQAFLTATVGVRITFPSIGLIIILPPSLANVSIATPQLVSVSATTLLAPQTGAVVVLQLPQPMWSYVEVLSANLDITNTLAVTAYTGSTRLPACAAVDLYTLQCTVASGTNLVQSVIVELGKLLNLTASHVLVTGGTSSQTPLVPWGSTVHMQIMGVEASSVTSIRVSPLGYVSWPCVNISQSGASVSCVLQYASSAWMGKDLSAGISLANGRTFSIASIGAQLTPSNLLSFSTDSLASNDADINMTAQLPYPIWTANDVAADGMGAYFDYQAVRGWLGGVLCFCVFSDEKLVNCHTTEAAIVRAPFIVEIGGVINLTISDFQLTQAVHISPFPSGWSDGISLHAHGIGIRPPAHIILSSSVLPDVPCIDIGSTSDDTITCTLRFFHEKWEENNPIWAFQFLGDTGTYTLQPNYIPMSTRKTTILNVWADSADGYLSEHGGTSYIVVFPVPLLTQSDLQVLTLQARADVQWLAISSMVGSSSATGCQAYNATAITCIAPRGSSMSAHITVELGQFTNATSMPASPLSYNPPSITTSTSAMWLPSVPTPGGLALFLLGSHIGVTSITDFRIGVVPCTTDTTRNSTLFECRSWDIVAAVGATSGITHVSMALTFTWAGRLITQADVLTVYVRPSLANIAPRNVAAGSAIVLYGADICPVGLCEGSAEIRVFIGSYMCDSVSVTTADIVSCIVPDIPADEVGYPNFPVYVQNGAGRNTTQEIIITFPVEQVGTVKASGPLPYVVIPSDQTTVIPALASVVVYLEQQNITRLAASACSLVSTTANVQLLPVDTASLVSVASNASGMIVFGRIAALTSFNIPSVSFRISCNFGKGAVSTPLVWTATVQQFSIEVVKLPPAVIASQLPMHAWWLYVHMEGNYNVVSFPPVLCVAAVVAVNGVSALGDSVFLQGNRVYATEPTRTANFSSLILAGQPNASYTLQVTCAIGSNTIPGTVTVGTSVSGCVAGEQPIGWACARCADSEFSFGGVSTCRACPLVGVQCLGGRISFLSGYYLSPGQSMAELGPTTLFQTCATEGACIMIQSEADQTPSFGCSIGYDGPLCGACDTTNGYARFGKACSACWSADANNLVVVLLFAAFAGLLLLTARRNTSGVRSDASILLRIILTYIQATGTLKSFKASGTKAYEGLMGFTEVASASPFSVGPLQCALGMQFVDQLIATILLPVVAAVGVILILSIQSCINTRFRRLNPHPMAHPSSDSMDVKRQAQEISGARRCWDAGWVKEGKHTSTFLFVAKLAYMPIISTSLRALDCSEPVDGVQYLKADMSIPCTSGGQYAILQAIATLALVFVGAGFPIFVFLRLILSNGATLLEEGFRKRWGVLYDGYKLDKSYTVTSPWKCSHKKSLLRNANSGAGNGNGNGNGNGAGSGEGTRVSGCTAQWFKHLVWWESVVFLRKACLVLMAVLVVDVYVQIAGAVLLIFFFFALQMAFSPYERSWLNAAELATLSVLIITASASSMLVETAGVSTSSSSAAILESRNEAATLFLGGLNISTLLLLAIMWIYLTSKKAATVVRRISARVKSSKHFEFQRSDWGHALPTGEPAAIQPHTRTITKIPMLSAHVDDSPCVVMNPVARASFLSGDTVTGLVKGGFRPAQTRVGMQPTTTTTT
jgi:hypothetical protein